LALLKNEEPGMFFGAGAVPVDIISLKPFTIGLLHAFIQEKLIPEGIFLEKTFICDCLIDNGKEKLIKCVSR
jgi:hypothetical protein